MRRFFKHLAASIKILLLIFPFAVQGQQETPIAKNITNGYVHLYGSTMMDSVLFLPVRDTTGWNNATFRKLGRFTVKPQDRRLYFHDSTKWQKVALSSDILAETDPLYSSSVASSIVSSDVQKWNKVQYKVDSVTKSNDSLYYWIGNTKSLAGVVSGGAIFKVGNGLIEHLDTIRVDTSLISTKANVLSQLVNYYTKVQVNDSLFAIRAYIASVYSNYYTKAESDGRYLQSYTETDPRWILDSSSYYKKVVVDLLLSGKSDAVHTHAYADITGKPSTFTPSSHTHSQSEVTGLVSALNAKQDDLGYVPEDESNKASNFSILNNTLYPSVLAVKNYVDAAVAALNISSYLTISSAASTYVSLTGSYTNPSWLTSLAWSKITGTPTTIAGYGITDYNSLWDTRLGTKTTDNLTEGATNKYFSNSLARTAISETVTGLDYNNTSGVFSLTSGYVIPTTTQETNWNTAYSNRIATFTTTGSSGAATFTGNTLNIPTPTIAGLGGVAYPDTLRTGKVSSKYYTDSLRSADRFIDSSSYYISPLVEHATYSNITGSLTRVGNTTWRATVSNIYSVGRANRVLPSGKDGWYSMRNFSDAYCGIVLDTTTPTGAPTFLIAVVIYNGTVYFGLNNSYPATTGATANYYRLRRSGSNWYAESSNDEKKWTIEYTYTFSYTGVLYPYALMPEVPRLGRLYEPKLCGFATTGCIIGNSTVAAYAGQSAVDVFMFNAQETATGFSATNLAVPGNTIDQQRAAWEAQSTATKKSYQWIIAEIGLNDLDPTVSTATTIAKYQQMVDTFYSQKSPNCKIILASMTPLKARLQFVYPSTWATAWQKWKDLNTAIMGGGATPITKADYRFNQHTVLMENANGNLDTVYEVYTVYDHVHQNNAGRALQAKYYVQALQEMKLLPQRLEVKKPLTVVANLNFGSTAAQNSADLTIPVIGAALGDRVDLGVPNSSIVANSAYTAFVSATNTVTVRLNNYSSGSVDPSAGDFEVTIYK